MPNIVWIAVPPLAAALTAQLYGRGAFFLVLAAAVLLGAIAILWNSVQALTGDAPLSLEEALSLAAPSTEEERKASVLRALKDLEYERSVGKLSDEDYKELTRKYRAEAKQLLLLVDENLAPARERAEALLAMRLHDEQVGTRAQADKASPLEADGEGVTTPVEPSSDTSEEEGSLSRTEPESSTSDVASPGAKQEAK